MNIQGVINELKTIDFKHKKEVSALKNAGNELNVYRDLIIDWSKDRGLNNADPSKQLNKLVEEVGELANGINKDNHEQVVDSIGDTFVVITIMCEQLNIKLEDCVATAWHEIKNRKGKTVDGMFIKEEDLIEQGR